MWGLLQDEVFSMKPRSLEHLKELIAGHFDVLFKPHLCKINEQNNAEICQKCVENEAICILILFE